MIPLIYVEPTDGGLDHCAVDLIDPRDSLTLIQG